MIRYEGKPRRIHMLDKSIEFHSIIMKHPNNKAPILPVLPQGFSIRFYEEDDDIDEYGLFR